MHQHLVREGLRTTAGLVVETGSAREVHHFARARRLRRRGRAPVPGAGNAGVDAQGAAGRRCRPRRPIYNYVKAIGKGLSKIMSKMGVSTYMCYCGAQMFEAIGLEQRLRRQVLPRHRQPGRRHRRVRGRRRSASACTSAAFGDDPVLAQHARRRRRIRLARARRRAHVDARRDRQAAAQHARQQLRTPTRNTPRSSTTRASAT